MKIFRILGQICLIFCSLIAEGQILNTSHQVWNLPTYNVGALTSTNSSRITFDYRRSFLSEQVSYTSASVWMDYPILNRNRNLGAAFLMIENERSGGDIDFKTININVALAKRILLSRFSHLIFGLGAGYRQFGLSLDGLTTSSQYIDEIGFDISLPNGESSGSYRSSYITVNSGLFYQKTNSQRNWLLQIGISANNLNRQLKTWGDQGSNLPIQWSAQLHYLAFTNSYFAVGPDMAVFKQDGNYNGVSGLSFRYFLGTLGNIILPEENRTSLSLFFRIATQKKGIAGIQYSNGKFITGVSYDFPFGRLTEIYHNAFEILFALTPQIHKRYRNKPTKIKAVKSGLNVGPIQKKSTTDKKTEIPRDRSGVIPQEVIIDSISVNEGNYEGKISAGNIVSDNIEVNPGISPLYFITGSYQLDDSSREFLEKVYSAYLKNGAFRIILTGHTDNVGNREDNQELSLNRARAAAGYLMDLGVADDNIEVKGKGKDEPLAPNDSVEGRARNRRVEITVIRK